MAYHKNLKSLFSKLQQDVIPDILGKEVYQEVVETESEMMQRHVYDAYDPVTYERRGASGGLADPRNHVASFFYRNNSEIGMLVQNTTKGKDQNMYLAGLVEYGHGGGYGEYQYPYRTYGEPTFLNPRRFTYQTILELERTLKHVEAFRSGLKRHGVQTYK